MEVYEILECLVCGSILDHEGRFCSDECEHEYYYTNRNCEGCGGEFWDGGTSCTCIDWNQPKPKKNKLYAIRFKPEVIDGRLFFNDWSWKSAKKNIHDYYDRGYVGRQSKGHPSRKPNDDLPF